MALHIIRTQDAHIVGPDVRAALRAGIESSGSVVLLVPSLAQALDAQRSLAREPGLSMAVTTTTPSLWVKERWEVWGDGRSFVDGVVSCVVAREAIVEASEAARGKMRLSEGLVRVLSSLANQALPWLPVSADGSVDGAACAEAGLTQEETRLVGLAGSYGVRLAAHGYIAPSQASAALPGLLVRAGAELPPVVCAGFSWLGRAERELLRELAVLGSVTLVAQVAEGPASGQARRLLDWFAEALGEDLVHDDRPASAGEGDAGLRAPQLEELRAALFGEDAIEPGEDGRVELLLPSGPVAEAEAVARCVERLLAGERQEGSADTGAVADGAELLHAPSVVVAVPDVLRARRELVPKLAERGISVRLQDRRGLADCPAALGFFSFARTVARLAELAAAWPEPADGLEGPVMQLGDMSWWPPRDLTDFLLCGIAHMDAASVWRLDAQWRGNRLLTPGRVLEMLQSERFVSASVARSTAELLRGRLGSAASRLLAPYLAAGTSSTGTARRDRADEERAVLQAIITLARTLRDLGLTADPAQPGAVALSHLVQVAEWAAMGMSIVGRQDALGRPDQGCVRIASVQEASLLPQASVASLVVCGLTTAEAPVGVPDDLLRALLEQLGVEPAADPMADARASFHALVSVPRERLVLERALYDADSKVTYPSVMLSELLCAYGIGVASGSDSRSLPTEGLPETVLGANLAPAGVAPRPSAASAPAPAGRLGPSSQGLVFVPQEGSEMLPGGKPVLSASQIETYLDCPYKWFSLRRLRLGTVDAGHTGMEMGTFAHRVLEVTHRELLTRALEQQQPGVPREELLAAIEADPVRSVPGSRVGADNIEAAQLALELEFDLHQQHMYMVKRPRAQQQLLVAHNSAERAQEDQLRQDLLSAMAYQAGILAGFEPRLFEWSFGRHEELVEYAGAYFTGTVDRIDVSPHGDAVIIDYKHKNPIGFAAEYDALQSGVLEGTVLPRRVQSLIYAQVVRRAFAGRLNLVGTVYLATRSPHALAGVADQNVADLVFGRLSSARAARVTVPLTTEGESGMVSLLDQTEALVADQVTQMLAGNVEARPRDRHSCEFCPVMQCERRVAR